MEPFTQDNSAFAFQKQPFAAPAGTSQGGALRPFTAVDLAPPAAPGIAPLGPAASPFLEDFGGAFDKGGKAAGAIRQDPAVEPRALSPFRADDAPPPSEDFMPVMPSVPEPLPSSPAASRPAPMALSPAAHPAAGDDLAPLPPIPAAARGSHILAPARSSHIQPAAEEDPGSPSSMRPRFFLTSTAVVDGYPIQAYLDVISVEIVLPKDLLFRNPAPYGELHRLKAAEDQLQKVKAKALEELTEKARQMRADGVVGVAVTFTNLDTVCCLCSAVGTAVRIA